MNDSDKALVVFQGKKIRRTWFNDEWWFSIVDIVAVLTESSDPRNYWKVLKHRLKEEGSNETVTKCNPLKLIAEDGKLRETDCANTETLFRHTRKETEQELGRPITSKENYLSEPEKEKKLEEKSKK